MKLEDPTWRPRPAMLPRFGAAKHNSSNGPSTPEQSPVAQRSPSPAANGHASPKFRFGVPSAQYLSSAGPGGDDFAKGKYSPTSNKAPCLMSAEATSVGPCCTGQSALLKRLAGSHLSQ